MAVMAERLFGFKVGRRQWIGVAMTAAGLLLLVITLPAAQHNDSGYSLAGMISFEAGMLVIGALLISGPRLGAPDHHHGIMLGAAAGTLFGVSDVAIKALTGVSGFAQFVGSPWLAVAIIASVVAFYASARGMQTARPSRSSRPRPPRPTSRASSAGSSSSAIPMPADTLGIVLRSSPSPWSSSPPWSRPRRAGGARQRGFSARVPRARCTRPNARMSRKRRQATLIRHCSRETPPRCRPGSSRPRHARRNRHPFETARPVATCDPWCTAASLHVQPRRPRLSFLDAQFARHHRPQPRAPFRTSTRVYAACHRPERACRLYGSAHARRRSGRSNHTMADHPKR
jgi:hypothetical protein